MIATIAAIAEKKSSAIIWENGNSSAIAATTIAEIELFTSQRLLSLRSLESGFIWSLWSLRSLKFFFFWAIVAIIWKPGLIYRNNHPPFLLSCYLYALQTYRTHSSKLRLFLVIRCISLVVDFVLLGGTNSVLLIWGLMVWILNKSQDPYHYRNCCSFHPPHSLNFDFKVFVFWESFSYFNWSVLFGGDGHINEQAVFFFFVLDYNVWSVGLYLTICLYWRIPQDCDVIFFCYCLGLMLVLFLVWVYIHLFANVPV